MRKLLVDIYYVWKNEMKLVLRDPAVLLVLIIVPLAYPVIYSWIYNNEIVTRIPILVVDDSQTYASREFCRYVSAASAVDLKGYETDLESAKDKMMKRDVIGILYISKDFGKNIKMKKPAEVLVFADVSNLFYYQAVVSTITSVSHIMGANIRASELGPGTPRQEEIMEYPIINEGISYYNPSSGFGAAIIPPVLALIIQQAIVLGVATIIGTHRDRGTYTVASHVIEGKYVDAVRLTIGKAFCYGTFYLILCSWTLGIVVYLFNFPQIGHNLTLLVFLQPYILACTFFAMTLSYFCSQREFPMLLFVFTSLLFLFISGAEWPWSATPGLLKGLSSILPSTYGIHGFVQINTMGASLSQVWDSYLALWILSLVYMLTAVLMYNWWIKNYDPLYHGKLPTRYLDRRHNNLK